MPITLREPRHRLAQRKQRLQQEHQALAPLAAAVAAWTDETPHELAQRTRALPEAVTAVLDHALRHRDRGARDAWIAALRSIGDRYWVLPWLDEYLHDFAHKDAELHAPQSAALCHRLHRQACEPPRPGLHPRPPNAGQRRHRAAAAIADANAYEERLDHLEPQHGELPYLALLVVTRFHPDQEWTVETLRCLLDQPMTIHLVIDIDARPLWMQRYQADREEALRMSDAGGAASNRDRRALKKTRGAAESRRCSKISAAPPGPPGRRRRRRQPGAAQPAGHHAAPRVSTWMTLARPEGSQLALARFFEPHPPNRSPPLPHRRASRRTAWR